MLVGSTVMRGFSSNMMHAASMTIFTPSGGDVMDFTWG